MKQILGKHSFFRAFICATGWESDTNGVFPGRSTQRRNDKTGRLRRETLHPFWSCLLALNKRQSYGGENRVASAASAIAGSGGISSKLFADGATGTAAFGRTQRVHRKRCVVPRLALTRCVC